MSWTPRRLRHEVSLNPPVPKLRSLPADAEVTFLPMEAIGEDGTVSIGAARPRGEAGNYTEFANDDVLFAKVTPCFENGKRAHLSGLLNDVGFGTTELTVLRAGPRMDPRFLSYLINEEGFRQGAIAAMTGAGGLRRVPDSYVRDFAFLAPDLDEQRQIAAYLDRETGQIDQLIAKQEQLLTTLGERRQALIARMVIQGLDTSTRRLASQTQWARDIPAHWSSGNIRRFAAMRTGHTPSRSEPGYWHDTSIPWFTLADVWQLRAGAKYLSGTTELISPAGLANSAAELLPAGTVILSRTASVGFFGIMPRPMATSQDFWNWVCGPKLMPEYLWYQFGAMRPYLRSLMRGSTHKTIYKSDAASLQVVVPPLQEQGKIVQYLNQQTGSIDNLMAKANQMIALLLERRQALISAAVTGKSTI